MNTKWTLLVAIAMTAAALHAEKIDINGDFEKCKADSNGVILPEGWEINKSLTKKSEIRITKKTDEVRGGKFALCIENEKDGIAYFMNWQQQVSVKPGDKINFSIWVKGKGRIALGFIQYGIPAGQKNSVFLGSFAAPIRPVASEDTWVETSNTYTVAEPRKDGKVCGSLTLIPIIYVKDAEFYLDDYTFELIKAREK